MMPLLIFNRPQKFFILQKSRLFIRSDTRLPTDEMTPARFMKTVKSGRFTIKATVLRFMVNFIVQMTGRG